MATSHAGIVHTRLTFFFNFIFPSPVLPWIGMAMPFHRRKAITYCVCCSAAEETSISFCFDFIFSLSSAVSSSVSSAPGTMFRSDKYLYTLCRVQSVNCKHRLSICSACRDSGKLKGSERNGHREGKKKRESEAIRIV